MVMCVGSDSFLFLSHPPAPGSEVSEESSDRPPPFSTLTLHTRVLTSLEECVLVCGASFGM